MTPENAVLYAASQDAETRAKLMARQLIGTRFFPTGYPLARLNAMEANAYHNMRPYPYWAFSDWKTEERGPLPRCLPLARRVVKKGAKWLFGSGFFINVNANTELEKFWRAMWVQNNMLSKSIQMAEIGGVYGGVVLKWSYDEERHPELKIQVLNPINDCRLFYDPHDIDALIMCRIQYPVQSPVDGGMYMYREEWTDEEHVIYHPVPITYSPIYRNAGGHRQEVGSIPIITTASTKVEPDVYSDWQISTRKPNPFGIIPVWHIRNVHTDGAFGAGDFWVDLGGGMFRIKDRINLTAHLMDRSNQFDSERNIVFLDVEAGQDSVDRAMQPGSALSLKSDNPIGIDNAMQGKVFELEAGGQLRPYMMDYVKELKHELLSAIGSTDVRSDEVSNKGAMTPAVLRQLYQPLIESTSQKRVNYGTEGISVFLQRCAIGLRNLGVKQHGLAKDHDEETVEIIWPEFFEMSEDDKTAKVARLTSEVTMGYNTKERALLSIADIEGIHDTSRFVEELKDIPDKGIALGQEGQIMQQNDVTATQKGTSGPNGEKGTTSGRKSGSDPSGSKSS